jgi:hypothetical protein
MKKIPVQIYHSIKQTSILPEHSKEMLDALQECGNTRVEYSLFTDIGPDVSATVFGDKRLYRWLLRQRK